MSDGVSKTTLSLRERAEREAEMWLSENAVTDWERTEIATLLCDHDPRDVALMVVRLQGQLEMAQKLRADAAPHGAA